MDLGGFLAGVRPEDSSDVLDKVSFPPDRGGEEQGVQGGAVEALADLGAGGHDQQRRAARLELQAGQGRSGSWRPSRRAARPDHDPSPAGRAYRVLITESLKADGVSMATLAPALTSPGPRRELAGNLSCRPTASPHSRRRAARGNRADGNPLS